LTQNPELERLENLAFRLGFTVKYCDKLSWDFSRVHFYPIRRIDIGIKNFSVNSNIGYGFIPEEVKVLILKHEIGHILVYKTLYPDKDLCEYCFSTGEFKIKDEIYAWKTALSELNETNIDPLLLEYAQESINEYVLCENCGTYIVEPHKILEQSIINRIKKVKGGD
jgi:hypothetical protein